MQTGKSRGHYSARISGTLLKRYTTSAKTRLPAPAKLKSILEVRREHSELIFDYYTYSYVMTYTSEHQTRLLCMPRGAHARAVVCFPTADTKLEKNTKHRQSTEIFEKSNV